MRIFRILRVISLAVVAGGAYFSFGSVAQARDVNAGPIWNQSDANNKCPQICRAPEKWNGQWRTTVPGKMSVCACAMDAPPPPPPPPPAATSRDVNAGPIWSQSDAAQKCPQVCRAPERWTGQWHTTVPGTMSVCNCAMAIDVSGVYDAQHPHWRDTVTLGTDGRYQRGNGDPGSWTFDGRTLVLHWDKWGPEPVALQPDGSFADPQKAFRLVRRAAAPVAVAPVAISRNPVEWVGTYDGTHPHWRDTVILTADGRYRRGNGDPGSWWVEGATLHLKWDRWGPAALVVQQDGSLFDARQNFRLIIRGH